ncbi:MAG TPA: sigma-70 family RNA polymerase sigma factor [Kofleriaceae bacterium]|nr:sigma-70 family RNA polymerase sigma factor [Kofleriaceae bacterium]
MPVDENLERIIAGHLASGDLRAAVTATLHGLGPQILGYLAATLRDDDAAYEVFGQFSEELWKSISTFRGQSSFKTWAYKIVMHSISRYRRDGFRRRGQPLGSDELSAIAEQVRSQTPPFQRTEVKDRFAQLRASLDPDEQTLLFLRIDQGMSWNEVAAVIAAQGEPVDVAALRKRFERAKLRLRKLAEQHGLLED